MKIDLYICNKCHKETKDYMKDGWIIIDDTFTKYKGRGDDGNAIAEIYISKYENGNYEQNLFCSWKCLMGMVKK